MFLPPNVTALIQPMDQNIIRLTKLYYRTSLLSSVIASSNVTEKLKKLTLKDAVICLNQAWNKLSKESITKCWENILSLENDEDPEDDLPLSIVQIRCNKEIRTAILETSETLRRCLSPSVNFFHYICNKGFPNFNFYCFRLT